MSAQMSFLDMLSVTSSPALASGASPFDRRDGRTTGLSGPDPAPVSLSARQAKAEGLLMSGTYGLPSGGSSASAALQLSLESRLRAKTSILGSTLYKLTWKPWVTPSGVSRSRLRASVLRTSETARIGWPTPRTVTGGAESAERKQKLGRTKSGGGDLQAAAMLTGWHTPVVRDHRNSAGDGSNPRDLPRSVPLCGWPTPMAGTPAQKGYNAAGSNDSSRKTVALATTARPARLTAFGEMLTGCSARTKSGGQLSPAHSLWLMLGPFATAWASCGERVTRSRSGKRKPSSNA